MLTKLKLMKLMYLAERESLSARGFPMIYDRLVCMKHGPVLSGTLDLMNYQRPSPEWHKLIRRPIDGRYLLLHDCTTRSRSLGRLSPHDHDIVRRVWGEFGDMSAPQLTGLTHTLPEYRNPGHTSRNLPYLSVLLALDKPPEMAQDLADDIAFHQQLEA